ncbi:MAG: putative transposase [bacterium]
MGRFFSSIYSSAVKGLVFFSLSLVGVTSKEASPLLMKQLDPKMKRQTKVKKKKNPKIKGKRGRPKGSKNKNRQETELTEYLQWIRGNILQTLKIIGDRLQISYFVYDGAFGNSECLQMVRSCSLSLISKLQCRSALWFPFSGEYKGRGSRPKYREKVNYQQLPQKYLMNTSSDKGVTEYIYQIKLWHRNFSDQLNVTIIQKKRLSDGKLGQVILFSNDLELSWEKMLLYYRLRFQIEFTYRDAKQFWGLEDFMNIKQQQVQNAANFSMFMVNFSKKLTEENSNTTVPSILDLKARFQASFYIDKIIKTNPEIQRVISIKHLKSSIVDTGCVYQRVIAA